MPWPWEKPKTNHGHGPAHSGPVVPPMVRRTETRVRRSETGRTITTDDFAYESHASAHGGHGGGHEKGSNKPWGTWLVAGAAIAFAGWVALRDENSTSPAGGDGRETTDTGTAGGASNAGGQNEAVDAVVVEEEEEGIQEGDIPLVSMDRLEVGPTGNFSREIQVENLNPGERATILIAFPDTGGTSIDLDDDYRINVVGEGVENPQALFALLLNQLRDMNERITNGEMQVDTPPNMNLQAVAFLAPAADAQGRVTLEIPQSIQVGGRTINLSDLAPTEDFFVMVHAAREDNSVQDMYGLNSPMFTDPDKWEVGTIRIGRPLEAHERRVPDGP